MTDLVATPSTLSAGTSDEEKAQEILATVKQLKDQFKKRDDLYVFIDSIIHRDREVRIPDAYQKTAIQVHSPFPTHIANTITSALSINQPSVQFDPVGFGDSFTTNATLREHFFDGSWRRQEEDAKRRLFRLFMYSLVTKGASTLKTIERRKSAWADYTKQSKALYDQLQADDSLDSSSKDLIHKTKSEELKRASAYPIRTTFVAPGTFYYNPGEDGMTVAAEVKEVPYLDTLDRYKMGLSSSGAVVPAAMGLPRAQWGQMLGSTRTLKMTEYWDWEWCYYLLTGPGQTTAGKGKGGIKSGSIVKKFRHGYGDKETRTLRGPYFHALGITTDSTAHERSGISVLYGFLELFPLLDSLLTIKGNSAYLTGYASFKRKFANGANMPPAAFGSDGTEADGDKEEFEPGQIYPYDIEPVEMPAAGADFTGFLADVRQMIEMALPSIVQGVVSGDESGYALNSAIHVARLGWDPIVSAAEDTLAQRVGFESWLIENKIKETVYAWANVEGQTPKQKGTKSGWIGFGPDDSNGVHRYNVRLNPELPSNKIIQVRTHEAMLGLQLETHADAIIDLGGNPDEVERGLLLEKIKADPLIQQKLRDRVMQMLSLTDQKALAPQMQAVDAQGGAPGGQPTAGLAGVGDVHQPGLGGVPLTPTPPNSVTGMGPGQPATMIAPVGPMPPPTAGVPGGIPNLPQNAQPLPGQQ